MHKFAALRRVFHSASRQGKIGENGAAFPKIPANSIASPQSSAAKSPSYVRRPSPSSIFQLTVPPIPAPLAEPVKAVSKQRGDIKDGSHKSTSNVRPRPQRPLDLKRTVNDQNGNESYRNRVNNGGLPIPYPSGHELSSPATSASTHGNPLKSTVRYLDLSIYQELKEALRIKPTVDTFDLIKTVGTGSFGRVYMAKIRNRPDAPPVAIKRLTKAAVMKQKQVDHVLSEKNILSRVDHPFLVRMYGTFQDQHFLYIVMEYVEGGEFFTFLRKSKRLDPMSARFYAGHVTSIFEYLHPLNVIYRDLKPENLLITRNGYLKLTDFGFAKVVDQRTFTLCGTPEYIAPEVLLNKGHGKAVDWWTLGILVYEMIVGYPPFFDEDALGIYQKILAGKIVFPRYFQRDAKSLVKRLLTHDLTRRFGHVRDGISDVRCHRWFESFDFDALNAQTLEAPYIPNVKALDDTSNFGVYNEAAEDNKPRSPAKEERMDGPDPFIDW